MKPINEYSSNEFHRWQREHLPHSIVVQDIDAWLICVSDGEPRALLELKRSRIPVAEWQPFEADAPNFRALIALAERARLPLRIVYWQMGVEFEDETPLAIWCPRLEHGAVVHDGPNIVTTRIFKAWLS